jgi:hypothetical protein
MPGGFRDPAMPAGFAPCGIQAVGANLFVTYATQDADRHDDVVGAGHGIIDVYDTAGNLKQRFATGGQSMGPLDGPGGSPIVENGIGGLAFGDDLSNQPSNTLFFAAGPNDEANGLYRRIDLNSSSNSGTSTGSGTGTGTSGGASIGM